jgi:hypothetical protein
MIRQELYGPPQFLHMNSTVPWIQNWYKRKWNLSKLNKFCPRKQLLSAFWQANNVCLNFFSLFG